MRHDNRRVMMSPYGDAPSETSCTYGDCESRVSSVFEVQLCDRHALAVYREVRSLIVENQELALPITIEAMVDERERTPAVTSIKHIPTRRQSVVYFIQFGDRIKIGTTFDLDRRMSQIPVDAILATIPGDYTVEAMMHARFASARIRRTEWFTRSPELLEFIDGLQSAS